MTLVIDANVALALVLPLAYSSDARACVSSWLDNGTRMLAPTLFGYEVVSGLRKSAKTGLISATEAMVSLDHILAIGIEEVPPSLSLHRKALAFAERIDSVVAYDTAYMALAESRGVPLYTADRKLVAKARASNLDWVVAVGGNPG